MIGNRPSSTACRRRSMQVTSIAAALAMGLAACGQAAAPVAPGGGVVVPGPTPTPTSTPAPTPTPPADDRPFGNETPVILSGYDGDAMEPFLSPDGRTLFFNNRNDPAIDTNLYYASRVDDRNFVVQGTIAGVNSTALDGVASLDSAGNFYFVSTRSYTTTASTLYFGHYADGAVSDVMLVPNVSRQQPGIVNFDAEVSADGNSLWFDDGQFSSTGMLLAADIVVADKQAVGFVRRSDSAAILATVNSGGLNYAPSISADGLELFFTRFDSALAGSTPAIWRAARAGPNAAFGIPQRVAAINGFAEAPTLSADGKRLYFHKLVGGRFQLFKVDRR